MPKQYKDIKIIIDKSPHLGYETNNIPKKILNLFFIPLLNHLPKDFQKHIKKTHKSAEEVINHATSHRAIEILYKKGTTHASQNIIQKIMHGVWFNTNNAKAVRNRLRLVEKELKTAIDHLIATQSKVNILSIASGSARAIIEVLASVQLPSNKTITVKFLDKNLEALEYSKDLAKNLPSKYKLEWITDNASNFPQYYEEQEKPDIIEMVGLMDYFHDPWAIRILGLILEKLAPDGVLITANIVTNSEQRFVSDVVGWKMIYRTPEDLVDLALTAGFKSDDIKIICEPLKIHAVLVAKK